MVPLMISSNRWLSEVNRAAFPLARAFCTYSTVMCFYQGLGNRQPDPVSSTCPNSGFIRLVEAVEKERVVIWRDANTHTHQGVENFGLDDNMILQYNKQ